MRVFTAAVIWALVVEAILGLAFLAGYCWIGGWQVGLFFAGAALLILALPWIGDLRARYDSADGSVRVNVGWWGRATVTQKPTPLFEAWLCGIPWRKKLGSKKSDEPVEPPVSLRSRVRAQVSHENVDDITRAVTAALAAGNDLLWDAREVYFRIDAPAESAAYDDVITRIVAHRGVGPVDVKVTRGDGKRRIRARYQIGLFRAAAISLCMAAQGRVWSLRKPADDERAPISDEELVCDIAADMKAGDDDGV